MAAETPGARTERGLEQGRALVRAIVWLLLLTYTRRPRGIVAVAPGWTAEQILSASHHIADSRPAVWLGEN